MSASCYKIVPNRHVFLDFMITLDLSPEQRHCVETFPIRYVEVDEARNTWKISYDAAAGFTKEWNINGEKVTLSVTRQ